MSVPTWAINPMVLPGSMQLFVLKESIGKPPYLSAGVDPWAFLVIPRTYFRANIPDTKGGFVLAYNLMMLAIVAVCVAAIHFAFDEKQRRSLKRRFANLIASMKKEGRI